MKPSRFTKMSTIYDKIKDKLEKFPEFKERRFRRNKLAILSLRELGLEHKLRENIPFTLENLVDFASKYDSYRHEYDAVQKDNKHLRGTDYEHKTRLVQEKQIEFGYEGNYYQDIKKLKTL